MRLGCGISLGNDGERHGGISGEHGEGVTAAVGSVDVGGVCGVGGE